MNKEEIDRLAKKYIAGRATEAEAKWLHQWYDANLHEGEEVVLTSTEESVDEAGRRIFRRIREQLPTKYALPAEKSSKLFPDRRMITWLSAASVLIVLSVSLYFFIHKPNLSVHQSAQKNYNDVLPGGNRAVLTLADGSRVELDGSRNGLIARQSGIEVRKADDGQIVYEVIGSADAQRTGYNTIETPRGGQYQIILPDGSKVWLNAASSLKYPVKFAGGERKVELSGEAYFEIAQNKNLPFKVTSQGQEVKVLGTHFNINSYTDEPAAATTLLEGSVAITRKATNETRRLRPGQQARIDQRMRILEADVNDVIAWKNGKIQFSNMDIQSVMRMLSRWYNIEVVYEGPITQEQFGGSVSRNKNISEVLKILELTGEAHFKIEGRRVTVMK